MAAAPVPGQQSGVLVEPSGGGRSIPQHRRMYARARVPARVKPVEQRTGPGFRRTWRSADNQEEGRLGGRSWAMGRGAAPPRFGRDRRG